MGGLPEDLEFELVEPLRMLFKDEVRQVGAELGLSDRLVWRQPFPGPGLAIRVVGGEVNKERLEILRDADAILQDEIRGAGLYRELWQSFCVLPGDLRSVGVQGDERTYGYVVVIRAVTSDDAMTADWARLPYDLLERVASRMINEIAQVNRVTLDITASRRARSSGSRGSLRPEAVHELDLVRLILEALARPSPARRPRGPRSRPSAAPRGRCAPRAGDRPRPPRPRA